MDVQSHPKPERYSGPVDFENYRTICDANSEAYRPVGIISSEAYIDTINDDRTVLVTTEYGTVPILTSIDHSEGYDIERCKQLTDSNNVFLLSMPAKMVETLEIPEGASVIVELASSENAVREELLSRTRSKGEHQVLAHDFIDSRIDDPEHKAAFMGLYVGETSSTPDGGAVNETATIKDVFRYSNQELIPENGLTLFDSKDIRDNPKIAESLWGLFKNRFKWLGDFHPVSMEDTREVFESIILSSTTFTPMKFVNGELVCAGVVVNDAADIDWFKPDTVEKIRNLAHEKVKPFYYFGIAAKESDKNAMGNMEEVVRFHCQLEAKTALKHVVIFESSNMSSLYIPRITAQYINGSGAVKMDSNFEKIEEIDYLYLK